jgi:putative PEP-CTERM system TPR-repeat lipoprotein
MINRTLTALIYAAVVGVTPALAALPNNDSDPAQTYLADAQHQIVAGNLRGAEIQLKNAIKANPDNPASYALLATVYIALNNGAAAEAEVRLARQHGATEDSTAAALGRALYLQAKFNELFQQVKPGQRPAPEESAVRVALGLAHLALGETDNAAPLIDQAEKLNPDSIDAHIAGARLDLSRGDVAAGEKEVDLVLAKDPKRIEALTLKGDILVDKGDAAGAMARFDDALKIDSNNAAVHLERARVLIEQNKLDDAQKDLNVVLTAQPGQVTANYLVALIDAKQNKYQDADTVLTKVSAQFGQFPPGLYLQAAVKFQLKQYAQADSLATKVIARQPSNAAARRLLARVVLAEGDANRAVTTLQPLTGADSKDFDALSLLAAAYAAQNKRDQALDLYQRAAALQPDDVAMQTRLAMLEVNGGQVDKGLAGLEQLSQNSQGAKLAGPVWVLAALRTGKLDEAAKAAEALLKSDPADKTDLNLLGMVRVAQKNYADAEKIFSQIIEQDPNFLAARRNLASVYVMTSRYDDAKKVYQKILDGNSSDAPALSGLASVAMKQNDLDAAADLLKRAQAVSPEDASPGLDLMKLYAGQKQWPKAVEVGRQLASQFPANVTVFEALGQVQGSSGDAPASVTTFKHVTELAPKAVRAWQEYANAQVQAKDLSGAHQSLAQALALDPGNGQIKSALVEIDYQRGGVDAALETVKSVTKDDPTGADILTATVLQRAGRRDDAIAFLDKAQQARPQARTLIFLAVLERQGGKASQAESQLQAWLAQHDSDLAVRQTLAESYLTDKKFDLAIQEFEKVYSQQPNNVVVLDDLAWLYQQKNDPRAREVAEKAFGLAPNAPAVADTLGWIILGNGDTAAALPYLKQAADGSADDMQIQYHFAVALQRSGQRDEARSLLQRIVDSKQAFDGKQDAEKLLGELQRG